MTVARGPHERAPRKALTFPVHYTPSEGEQVAGTCENLSESGLLALFSEPLDIWTRGTIDLGFGTGLLGIKVRVARVVGLQAGLAFQDVQEEDRAKLREMMRVAEQTGGLSSHL